MYKSHLTTNSTKQANSAVIKYSNDPIPALNAELSHDAAM